MKNEIWEAAEFITEWQGGDLTYKLYSVARDAIDGDSDEAEAHLLHGIDNKNVRRVDVLLDTAYSREIEGLDFVREAIAKAPRNAAKILKLYAISPEGFTMTSRKKAQEIVNKIQAAVGDEASITLHKGAGKGYYAARITGIDSRYTGDVVSKAIEIIEAAGLPASYRRDTGWEAVWMY